ncbi:type II toxin-antitoxin system RelE/ParE family toxin [Ohtaekwangia sp.]|uniref:type II toxin-antitoxin system RelE/ParE family toxin n=1 Tax=Ohtaekwangia sp. TaxID=2066019 RepID=UPI002FDC7F27
MELFLTRRAEKNYASIKNYIKDEWGEKTASEFILKTEEFFELLRKYPAIGQIEKNDIRGFQLSSQTRVLYRTKEDKIIVLAFFDVRQNPNKKF